MAVPSDIEVRVVQGHQHAKLIACMKQMKQEKTQTDFKLRLADGSYLACHRAVLSAASDFFQAMFDANLDDAKRSILDLSYLDAVSVKKLHKYFYTTLLKMSMVDAQPLINTIGYLQIPEIVYYIDDALVQFVAPKYSVTLLGIAQLYDLKKTAMYCIEVICNNFKDICLHPDQFLFRMTEDMLKEILASDFLGGMEEFEILQALTRWILYEEPRIKHWQMLSDKIKFKHCEIHHLHQHIKEYPVLYAAVSPEVASQLKDIFTLEKFPEEKKLCEQFTKLATVTDENDKPKPKPKEEKAEENSPVRNALSPRIKQGFVREYVKTVYHHVYYWDRKEEFWNLLGQFPEEVESEDFADTPPNTMGEFHLYVVGKKPGFQPLVKFDLVHYTWEKLPHLPRKIKDLDVMGLSLTVTDNMLVVVQVDIRTQFEPKYGPREGDNVTIDVFDSILRRWIAIDSFKVSLPGHEYFTVISIANSRYIYCVFYVYLVQDSDDESNEAKALHEGIDYVDYYTDENRKLETHVVVLDKEELFTNKKIKSVQSSKPMPSFYPSYLHIHQDKLYATDTKFGVATFHDRYNTWEIISIPVSSVDVCSEPFSVGERLFCVSSIYSGMAKWTHDLQEFNFVIQDWVDTDVPYIGEYHWADGHIECRLARNKPVMEGVGSMIRGYEVPDRPPSKIDFNRKEERIGFNFAGV